MYWLRKKHYFLVSILLIIIVLMSSACGSTKPVDTSSPSSLVLATTTSTENSGLLGYLLPVFTADTRIDVRVVAVGTGQALKMGEDGEADVLLVHAKDSEEQFVKDGHGLNRFDVMYNDFVLIGPKDDALFLREQAGQNIISAFTLIQSNEATFVSRGDDSGTHKMELALWKTASIEPSEHWYVSAGKGMGDVIMMTNEMLGYTLTDRATYLSMKEKLDLTVVVEGDDKLFNQYGIIAVNPSKNSQINHQGAQELIEWIRSEKGQSLIEAFGKDKFGQSLFIPNAK